MDPETRKRLDALRAQYTAADARYAALVEVKSAFIDDMAPRMAETYATRARIQQEMMALLQEPQRME